MTAAELPDRFDITRVANRTFHIVSRNIVVFGALTLLLYFLPHLGAAIIDETTDHLSGFSRGLFSGTEFLYGLLAAVGYFALQASIIHGAVADINGERADIVSCLKTGFKFIVPVFAVSLIAGIGIVLGLIALVVPGLMLLTTWFVVVPVTVIERATVKESFARTVELTRGYRWLIFAMILVFAVASGLIHGVIAGAENAAAHVLSFLPGASLNVASQLVEALAALVAAVGVVATYYELRMVKEDAGPHDLAGILE